MPSISHAVEWGIKCCEAPNCDDSDFNSWYATYSNATNYLHTYSNGWQGFIRNMGRNTQSGYTCYNFDCESFVNIALCLGGNWPQYGDEAVAGIRCFKGLGWDNAEQNSIAGDNAESWLIACGFSRITDSSQEIKAGDVVLCRYSGGTPGHAEMACQDGGNIVSGGYTMGAHGSDRALDAQVSANFSSLYWGTNIESTLTWWHYMYEDDDSTPIPGPGTGGGGGNNGKSGQKHRAWLYLRNPRLYNLRR